LLIELKLVTELHVENCVIRCFKWFSKVLLRLKPNSFDVATDSLSNYNTTLPFLVIAFACAQAQREVLVFLKNDGSERLKERSRCYMDDWGYYFNHLGQQGQRIGMHCKAVDRVSS